MILSILIAVSAVGLLLAAITAVGTHAIERAHPPHGRFVAVEGGRLHVVELGPADAIPVVLLHGSSSNLRDMQISLGARLAERYRVILIDRPGHGWSDRQGGVDDAGMDRQAALIGAALDALGIRQAVVVGHSLAGAVALAYALRSPERIAALVLLAPVSHPWPGGIAWFYRLAATPVIGPLFARTIVLPFAYPVIARLAGGVFRPQRLPPNYVEDAAARLVLRPAEFIANAQDMVRLKDSVTQQSARYRELAMPTVIIGGDRDTSVSLDIHARAVAATLPQAKLIVLPGVGHAVQHAAVDVTVREIDALARSVH